MPHSTSVVTDGAVAQRPPPAEVPSSLVGGRYQLLNELGRGGMGTVYRALDRLTGRVVTLKRLHVGGDAALEETPSRGDGRLALAEEFRLLASLHHPNIVGVLDYGFDADRRPFLSMDLQENAQTIVEAGRGAPLGVHTELLVQLLRALAYLHRHGIIHRDLKPENVLVVGDQVKVLDFGLAVFRDWLGTDGALWAGTLAYCAPEILRGEPPSERSDLYAVGIIAYELFTGRCVSWESGHARLPPHRQPAASLLRREDDELDPRLRPVVTRLLALDPAQRYREASEVIDALGEALGQPLSAETIATRESFLQAAPFVGRDAELKELRRLLDAAVAARGSAWLVGGESGVGKSRLLEELRTRALVDGLLVVRGQAVSDGGSPYHVWRDVLSALVLQRDVSDQQAAVLKAIVPDVDRLLGRAVPDPPPVDSTAAQSRLHLHVEELFRSQRAPTLVLLEDLQWAGSESLKLLAALARAVGDMSVCLLGTFRSDEAPNLAALVECPNVLILRRLHSEAIARLGGLMIGVAGARPEVAALLERETEGIPLFIVEVVRALAEGAGTLADVGAGLLPDRLPSGGMRRVLQRRLTRLPAGALAPVRAAAVIGREIDTRLLGALHPDLAVDAWIARCSEAAVLESQRSSWWFAHDKLREQVLDDLSAVERATLHGRVAEAIEQVYPLDSDRYTALAHHWRLAGAADRELHYVELSARQALASGAYQEAVLRFERGLELLAAAHGEAAALHSRSRSHAGLWERFLNPLARIPNDPVRLQHGSLEAGLTEAYYRLGDLSACERHAERALLLFGVPMPRGRAGWIAGISRDALVRCAQRFWSARGLAAARPDMAGDIFRVHSRLTEVYFYSLRALPVLWSTLRNLNVAEPAGPSAELSSAYVHMAVVAAVAPLPRLAARLSSHAIEIAEATGTAADVAYALTRAAVVELAHCQWPQAAEHIQRAEVIATQIGDLRLCEEARTQAGLLALYHGPPSAGLEPSAEAQSLSRRSDSKQTVCWSLMRQADILLRLGRTMEALALYEDAARQLDERAMLSEAIWAFGCLALAHLRLGHTERALEHAEHALRYISTRAAVAFWTQQGTAATADVLLSLLERRAEGDALRGALVTRAAAACAGMRAYARRFALGRAHVPVWDGLLSWLTGRPRRALRQWHRAIEVAAVLETPYEGARAHLEIGRHLPREHPDRMAHLESARAAFEQLGCIYELERTRAELA